VPARIGIPRAGHRVTLPTGWEHARAHATLTALLSAATGPETAGLFAAPDEGAETIGFIIPDGRVERFEALDGAGREALRAELGRLVSELRREAERRAAENPARDGELPRLVAAAIEVPSFERVHAHALPGAPGRPVLVGWGLAPAGAAGGLGLIARLDDHAPAPAKPRTPAAALAATAILLALLAGAAVMATPWIAARLAPESPACRAVPGELDALLLLLRERDRERDLRARLAELERDVGLRRAACPLPEPSPPPEPPPRPEPPPPPPRPPTRPADAQPCDVETQSGGRGVARNRHFLGDRPGRVTVRYNMLIEPDQLRVFYRGRIVVQTPGPVSGRGTVTFDWRPTPGGADAYVVEIEVIGRGLTTRWSYMIACPDGG
jgi:hypothetical protein